MPDQTVPEQTGKFDELQNRLKAHQQEHVLQFWDEISESQRKQLATQIDELDLVQLDALIAGQDAKQDFAAMAQVADPPPSVDAEGSGANWTTTEARLRGEQAIRDGQVGAVIVAGGQGTRLGFPQPKGMFPIGPVSNRTLFQFFADRLIAIQQAYSVKIPLFVMTSEATDDETRAYFQEHNYLGLSPNDVVIFKQGTMPAVDAESGKLLLAKKDSLALSPDGHGGTVAALQRSGCLQEAKERGVRQLAYIQVDNPLAHLCDPTLLGHHLMAESEMTTQVIRKRYATERVGNVVSIDGKVHIIEYSDLPESAAEATDEEGQLRLWAGNIAVHIIDVDFLQRVSDSSDALPFHRALKKVPYLAPSGRLDNPAQPNATKFERFIFDLLPQAKNAFVVEVLPCQGFAPVKNADGAATDTPSLARRAISELHQAWIESSGGVVGSGVQVEINPRFAMNSGELSNKISPKIRVETDRYFDTPIRMH
ncbi:UDPGP type 1 family protein [Rubripirellula sp.]|nr:UDPGP type 1 family protein [Rubripirellula sp.]